MLSTLLRRRTIARCLIQHLIWQKTYASEQMVHDWTCWRKHKKHCSTIGKTDWSFRFETHKGQLSPDRLTSLRLRRSRQVSACSSMAYMKMSRCASQLSAPTQEFTFKSVKRLTSANA